ncbi:oligopeptide transporter OPT1 SCDLUD_000118 [Saccharomycodes ludwigii]|uniref:oligopeptide transporter OPT1 n=1 Tax=Saccharomycodes ludwigii TaxID=36035 RepID=UPI001E8AABB1|nr:hypothetical protein SCDLUD_000118 [Saccharomycodes ludwigii]KAH3902539.1 hypothetical protein SCDLUD_000118 [Saccharomycodes ludwigii]
MFETNSKKDLTQTKITVQPSSSEDEQENTEYHNERLSTDLQLGLEMVRNFSAENVGKEDLEGSIKNDKIQDQQQIISEIDSFSSFGDDLDESDETIWEGDPSLLPNSPFPEVRSSVPNYDDEADTTLNHWRTWFLVTIFVVVFAGVNQFFSLRYPTLSIDFLVAQVVCFPVGKLLSLLPDWSFHSKNTAFNNFFKLNPGPFTKKEHAVVTIAVALTASTAYAMNILIAQTNFYNIKNLNAGYQLLVVWTSQMLGYGAAGLTRRWVVYPASCIWPQTLISVSLFQALHSKKIDNEVVNGWKLSRYRFLAIVFTVSFVWYWVPGFLFTGLSYFNFILWGKKTRYNFIANTLFGTQSGLGLLPISFDYTQASQAMSGSVFATPFWVSCNTYASVLFFFGMILPILYFTNTWYAKYMPVISGSTYDNTQAKYNVTKIINSDYSINFEKYKQYSPLFVPFSYLLTYALNFAAVIAIFVHCFATVCGWRHVIDFPAWAFVIALLISFVNFIPQGILEALTNQHIGLNIITELVCGYMLPLKPMANVMFKLYGFIVMRQGLGLSRDLKLAIYMKVPPKLIFCVQIYATIISGLVNVGIQEWMRSNIKDLCSSTQSDGFTCSNGRTIFNASIIWSLPKYLFSPGRIYNPLLWFFLIGLLLPLLVFFVQKSKIFPKSEFINKIHTPIFFTGPGNIPPSTPYNYSLFFAISASLKFIRTKWPRWFSKYNFVLGSGVESGVAIAVVVIFLCVQYPGGKLNWWGNEVWKNTYDNDYKKYYTLKEGETFGYNKWW